MGLQVLEREKAVYKVNPNNQPDLAQYSYCVERQLKPEARKDIIELFEELDITPNAMIDISDGLSSEIFHLCKASSVGCNIYEEKLPADPQTISISEEFKINSTTALLNGGEDYELLMAIKTDDYDKIKSHPFLTPIGHQCNAIILGPGGYKFSDYWKMGLPLEIIICLLYTSPSPRDRTRSRMPSSA